MNNKIKYIFYNWFWDKEHNYIPHPDSFKKISRVIEKSLIETDVAFETVNSSGLTILWRPPIFKRGETIDRNNEIKVAGDKVKIITTINQIRLKII